MVVDDMKADKETPNYTAYTRWSCHSGMAIRCVNCVDSLQQQQWGSHLPFFGKPAMRTSWMADTALIKAGEVGTNPGPTTPKKVWMVIFATYKYMFGSRQR